MNTEEPHIDIDLARRLVKAQFPRWAGLDVSPVENEGWCSRAFRLGEQMIIRMPRHLAYAEQITKEYEWLPRLAPKLPIAIPEPVALGTPAEGYPWNWTICKWISGETAEPDRVVSMSGLAHNLAAFITALHRIDTQGGPAFGPHIFYRGGPLTTYDAQTRKAIATLGSRLDSSTALAIWDRALASSWQAPSVWVHGDVSVGNLLVRDGQLCAVIDFGNVGVGDPACDLAIGWNVFDSDAREVFRHSLGLDADTWARGRAWALWKALILASGLAASNAFEASRPWSIIEGILSDHRRTDANPSPKRTPTA